MPRSAETARQVIHMTMGGFALLLRYLAWWHAAPLAAAALAFNVFVLPRIGGRRLYREPDIARGFPAGILLYPTSVLLLILIFPHRLDIVAAAWGILAFGDGAATIVGRAAGRERIPWNREKTVVGTTTLFAVGGVAGTLLAIWCRPSVAPEPPLWFSLGAPIAAALAAALVETIPVRLDDNVSVPATAAAVLWSLSLVNEDIARSSWEPVTDLLIAALTMNAAVAWIGYRVRTVSISGAVSGAVIGTVIFASTGWRGWLLLFVTFLAASVSSRLGLQRKTLLGIAEARGGRRSAGNAFANTGIAAVAAILSVLTPSRDSALVAFAAALTAGGSDTIASEIGKAWGRHAYLVPTFRSVAPGTSGAVSPEGTGAGIVAALALGSAAVVLSLVPASALLPLVLAATIGSFAESALGATLEAPGILNNDLLNFLNTAVAALIAILLAGTSR
jgi:uncharacterized protein (TIGR00297 family)